MVATQPEERSCAQIAADFDAWLGDAAVALRRILVARNGLADGVEAAAEAMAWAVEHRDVLVEMSNPLGYLYRVGQSSLRRRWLHNRRHVALIPEVAARQLPEPDEELFSALARLTAEQRVAVVMVHMYGFTYRQVAELLEVSEAAVTNHVHRGLARLRRLLPTERNSS